MKTRHIMTFSRPAAIRRMAHVLDLLEEHGPLSKHEVGRLINAVSRTSQTYLAELARRGEIHIKFYSARVGGGTPMALWARGPAPNDYKPPVIPAPVDLHKLAAKNNRSRKASRTDGQKAEKPIELLNPMTDTHYSCFWNLVRHPRKIDE